MFADRIERRGFTAGAGDLCVRHEFAGTENSTFDWIIVIASLFAMADNGLGFDCLVPGATFRVEKTEKFLERLGVGGVPEKRAVATHLDQILVLEFCQMMREG